MAQNCPSFRNLPLLVPLVPTIRPGHLVLASGQEIVRNREAALKEGPDHRHAMHRVPQGRGILRDQLWVPRAW